MGGARKTAAALQVLRGNPRQHPIRPNPTPIALADAPPADLDGEARAEWLRTIVPAIRNGHITTTDRTLAIAHCELYAVWRAQVAAARKRPLTARVGPSHTLKADPMRAIADRTLYQLTSIDEKLGFSPTSRSKVATKMPGRNVESGGSDPDRERFFQGTRG